jgi:hypothetical protein
VAGDERLMSDVLEMPKDLAGAHMIGIRSANEHLKKRP